MPADWEWERAHDSTVYGQIGVVIADADGSFSRWIRLQQAVGPVMLHAAGGEARDANVFRAQCAARAGRVWAAEMLQRGVRPTAWMIDTAGAAAWLDWRGREEPGHLDYIARQAFLATFVASVAAGLRD